MIKIIDYHHQENLWIFLYLFVIGLYPQPSLHKHKLPFVHYVIRNTRELGMIMCGQLGYWEHTSQQALGMHNRESILHEFNPVILDQQVTYLRLPSYRASPHWKWFQSTFFFKSESIFWPLCPPKLLIFGCWKLLLGHAGPSTPLLRPWHTPECLA